MRISRISLLPTIVLVTLSLVTFESAVAAVLYDSGEPNNAQWRNSDFSNQFSGEAADDFMLSANSQVSSVRWYGSYLFTVTQPMPDDFTINVYSDNVGKPADIPFHTASFTSLVSRAFTGVVVETSSGDFEMYEYEVSVFPVVLAANTKYWLSIVNNTQKTTSYGGWAWAYNTAASTHSWRSTSSSWTTYGSGDLAFSLHGDERLVQIDIKPGSDTNSINLKSNGVIPVAILGSIDLDATQVDFSSVRFGPGEANPAHDGHVEDINGDGYMDTVFHFRTKESGIACGDTEATITGETFGGASITGADAVSTVGCNSTRSSGKAGLTARSGVRD